MTEGAINVSDAVTDKLRVGMQLRMYQRGRLGGAGVLVEWVSDDYKVNDQFGFHAGKVKISMGLFNDSQDVDSLFLWILLPQCVYPVDNRRFDLSLLGGEVYGSPGPGRRWGHLQ